LLTINNITRTLIVFSLFALNFTGYTAKKQKNFPYKILMGLCIHMALLLQCNLVAYTTILFNFNPKTAWLLNWLSTGYYISLKYTHNANS